MTNIWTEIPPFIASYYKSYFISGRIRSFCLSWGSPPMFHEKPLKNGRRPPTFKILIKLKIENMNSNTKLSVHKWWQYI